MTAPPRAEPLRAGGRRALVLALVAAAAVTAASQVLLPFTVDLASSLPPLLSSRGLHPAEEGFRWTAGPGTIVIPALGRGRPVEVTLVVSAWRPRGAALPSLRLAAGTLSATFPTTATPAEVTIGPVAGEGWRGDVVVRLDSETFAPGRGDPRTLGVRLHALRVRSAGGTVAPGLPPMAVLLWAMVAVPLVFVIAGRAGSSEAMAFRTGLLAAAIVAAGVVWARPWTARILPIAVLAEAVLVIVAVAMPRRAAAAVAIARDGADRLWSGTRALGRPLLLALLALGATLGTVAAYRRTPVLAIPMGSGRETAFETGLGSFDSSEGVRFRHLAGPATLDLRDLGGGDVWRVAVTAATPAGERDVALADAGAGTLEATLGPAWSEHVLTARPAPGWRSGLVLRLPASRRDDVWVREVRLDRGRAWPPIRIVSAVLAVGLAVGLALAGAGLGAPAAGTAAAVTIAAVVAALAADPVAAIPVVPRLFVIAAAGAVLSALAGAVVARARAAASAEAAPALPPGAIAAGAIGFTAWLAATTTSLYRGGHFVFHSSIAEEIWKGRFLLYYLPYPGSMLSQQAQWGNVVVPHPCLYHTLVAPLAALPRPEFYTAEKILLALMLAAMAWASAALAGRVGPPGAAAAAAVLMASMPASFQLLGLGHLMTILGCWAMTMAVAFLAIHADRLGERRWWWRAVLLLALCFLAYFAGLLFMLLVVATTSAVLWRSDRPFARALLQAAAAAAVVAFALFYVNWTWPFLSESVPRLLGGSGAHTGENAGALPSRLAAVPHKLAYTFGSALVPVIGLSGLFLARRGAERVLLLAWAAILPVFTVLDLSFNFLLKHHYFTMVPVAIGGGVLLARLGERGRWGRLAALAALLTVAVLGARVGLDTATGRIP